MILKTLLCCALLATAAENVPDNTAAEGGSIVGRTIHNFTLSDYRGKSHSLSDFSDAKIVVIAFLGTECPIVKLYAQRLQELAERHEDHGVVVIGIDSNQHDSLAEMEHFARTHQLQFPLLKDPGNRIADPFDAQRTPEVFVLDSQRKVRYHGRIDDQYTYETQRFRKEHDYLATAVKELLENRPISTPETEVAGCQIGRVFANTKDDGVTYSDQISRILQRRCVECHRAGGNRTVRVGLV